MGSVVRLVPSNSQSGLTLVELVVTIAVSAVVISFMAMFISGPVNAYTAQARRAELVAGADTALRRLGRDVQAALPNTLRITTAGGTTALEMLNVVDAARYVATGDVASPDDWLDLTVADGGFATAGRFPGIVHPFQSDDHFLAIYNVGVPGADAYELDGVITPPGTQITITADAAAVRDLVRLAPAFQFSFGSPGQRVFLVDGPVTWLCDAAAGTLTRYTGYAIAASQADRDSAAELEAAGARAAVIARDVASCDFSHAPGTLRRAALLAARLELSRDGERVVLLHQSHVVNAP
jgi:MSHA biogenesis protein MshO